MERKRGRRARCAKEGTYVVIAYDQVGNRAVSESFQITDIDPYPPEIKVPPMLKLGGASGIDCAIYGYHGCRQRALTAHLFPRTGRRNNRLSTVTRASMPTMTRDGDTNRWQTGDIIESDFVSYYIIAYDAAGNRTVTDARYV